MGLRVGINDHPGSASQGIVRIEGGARAPGGTGRAGWEVRAQRGIPMSGTVRVSQARRFDWTVARESVAEVIKGAMNDQSRRSEPEGASGQQPETEQHSSD